MQPVIASVTFLSFGNNFFDFVGFVLNEESKQAKSGLIKISLFHLQVFHKKDYKLSQTEFGDGRIWALY